MIAEITQKLKSYNSLFDKYWYKQRENQYIDGIQRSMAKIFSNDKKDQDFNMPVLFENNFIDIGSYEEHYISDEEEENNIQNSYTGGRRHEPDDNYDNDEDAIHHYDSY